MELEHVALISADAQRLADFYVRHLGATATRFSSEDGSHLTYFLSFGGTTRLEINQYRGGAAPENVEKRIGIAHLAFLARSRAEVHDKTEQLRALGLEIRVEPTDYGTEEFYESAFLDPDGNLVELSVGPEYIHR